MKKILCLVFVYSLSLFSKPTPILETDDVIWSFDFISKNEIIYTERDGKLKIFNLLTKKTITLNIPEIKVTGQGGLLDVHFEEIKNKNYIYITFSEKHSGSLTTSLARGEYSRGEKVAWNIIFRAKVKGNSSRHFGSRLVFVDDFIFMTVGDRGKRKYAQDLSTHQGKILRLKLDGSVPQDNPFISSKNSLPEIWSYGHRNPQGIAYDSKNKILYSCEFGPRGGDELNLIEKGKNYGWPIITYGKEYWGPRIGTHKKKGMEQPMAYWVPSISPSGIVYHAGNIYMANLSSEHLRKIEIKNKKVVKQTKMYEKLKTRIRHVRILENKKLYFSTDEGKIYKDDLLSNK